MLGRESDARFRREGHSFIVGVDEAGRGPLAGPVVAAAVCFLDDRFEVAGVRDSKLMAESERERVFPLLTENEAVKWAVAVVDHKQIDAVNVLQATMNAMAEAVEKLVKACEHISKSNCLALIDGAMSQLIYADYSTYPGRK